MRSSTCMHWTAFSCISNTLPWDSRSSAAHLCAQQQCVNSSSAPRIVCMCMRGVECTVCVRARAEQNANRSNCCSSSKSPTCSLTRSLFMLDSLSFYERGFSLIWIVARFRRIHDALRYTVHRCCDLQSIRYWIVVAGAGADERTKMCLRWFLFLAMALFGLWMVSACECFFSLFIFRFFVCWC